jgi:prevent-host-death family protein
MVTRIHAADLHQRVGEILARIRFAGERFIIERRGKPVAAVVSVEDLKRLETLGGTPSFPRGKQERIAALERAATVRQLILTQRRGLLLPPAADIIRDLREERARGVTGLR